MTGPLLPFSRRCHRGRTGAPLRTFSVGTYFAMYMHALDAVWCRLPTWWGRYASFSPPWSISATYMTRPLLFFLLGSGSVRRCGGGVPSGFGAMCLGFGGSYTGWSWALHTVVAPGRTSTVTAVLSRVGRPRDCLSLFFSLLEFFFFNTRRHFFFLPSSKNSSW